jgi:NAD-dependent deacetylase
MEKRMEQAAEWLAQSSKTIALTGAGVSVESGIPDFRSAQGLWARYDPGEYATIQAFELRPERVWKMLKEMDALVDQARPNAAHIALGELERMGYLEAIITQNIDNLHQAGGARNVIEYHGNSSSLSCLSCRRQYSSAEKRKESVPRCACGRILKPDVVFFGETIPLEALNRSFELASSAGALLVIGTSAEVSPANTIPSIAKRNGARVIEVNLEPTHLTGSVADIFLQGRAGTIVPRLVETVKRLGREPI